MTTTKPAKTTKIADPAKTMITMSAGSVANLLEVLEYCDEFLRTTPAVRAELADFCLARPGLSSGWLIDMVSLHAYHLHTRLTEANQEPHRIRRPEPHPEPREHR